MRAAGARASACPVAGGDCCGALHTHAGRVGRGRARWPRRVIASMPGDAPVVVDSAGCGAAMKDYGRLVGTPARAGVRGAACVDFSEWVAAHGTAAAARHRRRRSSCRTRATSATSRRRRARCAPCSRPRTALEETADDGLCCGAGGAYSVREPELSGQIRDRKVAALRAAHRDATTPLVVVSANPGCAMHLQAAGLTVRHPAELLADALSQEHDRGATDA